jgi:hypothetical protein
MATNYKVLGQEAPSATTAADLYTVPASTEAVVSTVVVTNRGTGSATFRLSVRPAGASQANKHYLAYDVNLNANSLITLTLGITLEATDVLTVYASTADTSFQAFGTEIS